jgi:hypothetical protein
VNAAGEGGLPQPENELREVFVDGQKPFESMPLRTIAIDDQRGGCPVRAEPRAEVRVVGGLLANVDPDGHEVLGHELRDLGVRVHLGIQPSAAASSRGRAEVEQEVPALTASAFEPRVEVVQPQNLRRHPSLPAIVRNRQDDVVRRGKAPRVAHRSLPEG